VANEEECRRGQSTEEPAVEVARARQQTPQRTRIVAQIVERSYREQRFRANQRTDDRPQAEIHHSVHIHGCAPRPADQPSKCRDVRQR
jgi:hypothetical protein